MVSKFSKVRVMGGLFVPLQSKIGLSLQEF